MHCLAQRFSLVRTIFDRSAFLRGKLYAGMHEREYVYAFLCVSAVHVCAYVCVYVRVCECMPACVCAFVRA